MKLRVFVETGSKKVFAGAIDWPGWARAARTEEEALERLLAYGERYRSSAGAAGARLKLPLTDRDVEVVERLDGGSGTDFGVPSAIGEFDRAHLSAGQLNEQIERLQAAWHAFDQAAKRADGNVLTSGPRGGGRDVDRMREHVRGADGAYIASLGGVPPRGDPSWQALQNAFVDAIAAKLRGELPELGPRGGARWPARYAIRRSAWHALDHAWEIEDRLPR